jgi:hypothetical protein
MALVICLLIMVVAAMLGIGIATDASISTQTSRNQRDITRDFFTADGTNQVEVPRIATDPSLGVSNIEKPKILQDDTTDETITDITVDPPVYRAKIRYQFYHPLKQAGYSFNLFNAYFYTTKTTARRRNLPRAYVVTSENKVGPKL